MVGTLSKIFRLLPLSDAYAHCDIPCGIYDPYYAQVSAHTVLRMTQLIKEEHEEDQNIRAHNIARFAKVKEEHAEILKHEVRVIWGDYFKEEHLKDYPNLHTTVFEIMKLASKARQHVDEDAAKDLITKVQEFSEIFLKTKGVTPVRVPSLYPTGLEMVVYSK